jgi:cytochrome c553
MDLVKKYFALPLLLASIYTLPIAAADIKAGEEKAAMCVGCHGQKGNSSNAQWPILAGQQATYLINQLKAFKNGTRNDPTMQSMTANLSDDDISNLAAYFSSQKPVGAGGDPTLAQSGKDKATMCFGCHGTSAEGKGQFPRLAGQHPNYLIKQLKSFKEGARKSGTMQAVISSLSEEDYSALAAYFGSLKN